MKDVIQESKMNDNKQKQNNNNKKMKNKIVKKSDDDDKRRNSGVTLSTYRSIAAEENDVVHHCREEPHNQKKKESVVVVEEEEDEQETFEDANENITISSKMDLLSSLEECSIVLHLFLNNKFQESKDRLLPWLDKSVYHSLSYGAITFIQALMTCNPVDIDDSVEALKRSIDVCNRYRRKSTLANNSVTKIVKRPNYNSYTDEECHAELCYAESLLLRALISFLQEETLMGFIKGGLKIRTCYVAYKECYEILENRKWTNSTSKMHFESGVLLGIGAFNLIISILPTRALRLLEFIGFSGNRDIGLQKLAEGHKLSHSLRGPLCSLCLLLYHTVLTFALGKGDADTEYAKTVLEPVFESHPKGVVFMYFAGRIEEVQGNFQKAITCFTRAIEAQQEWRQFHLLCYWELSWCHMFLGQWRKAFDCLSILHKEGMWSKSISAYLKAGLMCACSDLSSEEKDEQIELMKSVPSLRRRIAGKSIQMEKFYAKRSQRFLIQDNWLILPALEMMYVWNYIAATRKRPDFIDSLLASAEKALEELKSSADSKYYVDNYCLATFLKGVCLRYMNRPLLAEECFTEVFNNRKKIIEDTHLVPSALLELGYLCIDSGDNQRALEFLEAAKNNYKGYSLESRIHFKIHAGLQEIKRKEGLQTPDLESSKLGIVPPPLDDSLAVDSFSLMGREE